MPSLWSGKGFHRGTKEMTQPLSSRPACHLFGRALTSPGLGLGDPGQHRQGWMAGRLHPRSVLPPKPLALAVESQGKGGVLAASAVQTQNAWCTFEKKGAVLEQASQCLSLGCCCLPTLVWSALVGAGLYISSDQDNTNWEKYYLTHPLQATTNETV